jgi:hypothetical protein
MGLSPFMQRQKDEQQAAIRDMSTAEIWLERIDRPWRKVKNAWAGTGISKSAVRRMTDAAVDVFPDASPRNSDIYVFDDGSGLWEKSKGDWRLADEETIAELKAENE